MIINLIMNKEERSPKIMTEIKQAKNLKINHYDPTPLPTHLPTTLLYFESSWKTAI